MPSGISRLHQNVKQLEDICVHYFDWFEVKEDMMRMNQTKIYYVLLNWIHPLWSLICSSEECQGWNNTSKMNHSFSKLPPHDSKNIILDRNADVRCAWSSIIGQWIPSNECCSLAINTQAMSDHLTHCNVDLRCAWTFTKCHHMLQLCHKYGSCFLHSGTVTQCCLDASWLPNIIGTFAVFNLS